jgi:hypothetical protein
MLGVKAWDRTGRQVRCRGCRHRWIVSASDPFYGASVWNNGLCFGCLLDAEITHITRAVIIPDTPGDLDATTVLGELDERADAAMTVFLDAHNGQPGGPDGGDTE